MSKPVIAIVGRPNVGKSTLFNKLIGERRAIVEDTPGVTRDRIYGETEWCGRPLIVIDTGGIEPKTDDIILAQMRVQAEIAIESADVIVFMCDVRAGLVADDREIAVMLKKSGKPIIPVVNKCDKVGQTPYEFYEFYELGFDTDPIPVSSIHGTGSGDLLDAVLAALPEQSESEDEEAGIKVAVIGKPNAGKSSIINRSAKIKDSVEHYSVLRAHTAVDRADVCLIMIDAAEGITEQDEKIAGIAHEAGRASIIVVNKWDSIADKDNSTVNDYNAKIRTALAYMPYAPILYVSALTGQRITNIFEQINYVYNQSVTRISTGMLNDVLHDATIRVQPPSDKGKRLKIYYMTQISVAPPTFVIFCNNAELFHFSYQRYIENCLRDTFGFKGTPIRLIIRERDEDKK